VPGEQLTGQVQSDPGSGNGPAWLSMTVHDGDNDTHTCQLL